MSILKLKRFKGNPGIFNGRLDLVCLFLLVLRSGDGWLYVL